MLEIRGCCVAQARPLGLSRTWWVVMRQQAEVVKKYVQELWLSTASKNRLKIEIEEPLDDRELC